MEKMVHAFLLLTFVGWPVAVIATAIAIPPVGLFVIVSMFVLVLFSLRFFKALRRQALEAYFAENQ